MDFRKIYESTLKESDNRDYNFIMYKSNDVCDYDAYYFKYQDKWYCYLTVDPHREPLDDVQNIFDLLKDLINSPDTPESYGTRPTLVISYKPLSTIKKYYDKLMKGD